MKKIKNLIRGMDKPLLVFTIFMIGYGLLNIVTASSREAVSQDVALYHYFYKQGKMLLVAFFGALIILNVPTKKYDKWCIPSYFFILSVLAYLTYSGDLHRGSKNWIQLAGITFQPSEFAKPVMIVCISVLFDKFYKFLRTKNLNHYNIISLILVVGCLFPFIVILQKDLGTAFILLGTFGVLFLTSPILKIDKFRTIVFMFIICMIGCMGYLLTGHKLFTEEQLDRFNFFNPCSNYENGGYQVCNGMIAINDGGLFGLGIGKSKQKYSYIPEPHTDSVFAIIMEEYGLIFSCILLFIYFI